MKYSIKLVLCSFVFLSLFASGFLILHLRVADAQTRPLTYPELLTALNAKLPTQFKTKAQLISWLIIQVRNRKVDKSLTADYENDLWQAGATNELIEAVRKNSPPLPVVPKKTPTPTVTVRLTPNNAESVNLEMVQIPAGWFTMGSDEYDDEKPAHRVNIDYSFFMGKYEITQAQWQAVMGNNPSYFPSCGGNCPVESINWNNAKEFINKLNSFQNKYEFRLPSEAEWEYACRAGTSANFAFGDSLNPNQANFNGENPYDESSKGNSLQKTTKVGSYQPNDWGLYDMHGNVWEWVEDIYNARGYQSLPTNGSANTSAGDSNLHVLRGGSWENTGADLRSTIRFKLTPTYNGSGSIGFRVAARAK